MGLPLSAQAIRDYKLSKAGKEDVSLLLVPPETPGIKKFSFSSLAGEVLEAVGLKKKPKPVDSARSTQVSRSKRRGPLLANVDLGSMQQLDQKLQEKK